MRQTSLVMVLGVLCLIGSGLGDGFVVGQAHAGDAMPAESENDAQRRILMKAMQGSVDTIRTVLTADQGGQRTGIAKRVAFELHDEAKRAAKVPPEGNTEFAKAAMQLSEDAGALSRVQGDSLDFEDPAAKVFKSWEALKKANTP